MSWSGFASGGRVWACSSPQDLRRGASSLSALV